MTAKEKAKELHDSYKYLSGGDKWLGKMAAIECCREVINAIKVTIGHCTLNTLDHHECMSDIKYWKEVIKEIEKL